MDTTPGSGHKRGGIAGHVDVKSRPPRRGRVVSPNRVGWAAGVLTPVLIIRIADLHRFDAGQMTTFLAACERRKQSDLRGARTALKAAERALLRRQRQEKKDAAKAQLTASKRAWWDDQLKKRRPEIQKYQRLNPNVVMPKPIKRQSKCTCGVICLTPCMTCPVPRGPRVRRDFTHVLKINWWIGSWSLSRRDRNRAMHSLNGNISAFCSTGGAGGCSRSRGIRVAYIPSGEGKTTFARRHSWAVDHDSLYTPGDRDKMDRLVASARATGDWARANEFARQIARKTPEGKVLLTWGPSTAPKAFEPIGRFTLKKGTGVRENQANREALRGVKGQDYQSFAERDAALEAAQECSGGKIRLRGGADRMYSVPRSKVSNFAGKAAALQVMYDIDPLVARQHLRAIAEKDWKSALKLHCGIDSPYDIGADALTAWLVDKPGARKIGQLEGWDRWPRDLAHGDRWLEAWLGANEWATMDEFGEKYQKEPYGFSLKIEHGPGKWTEGKMHDWAHPIVRLNQKNFRRARALVSAQYATTLASYMSQREVVESPEYRKTKGKSRGFFGALGRNKLEVAENPAFKRAVRDFIELKTPAHHMAFPKPETLKLSKIERKGPRMIVGAALEMEMVERMATQQFALSMIEKRWELDSKIGIHNNEWNRLYRQHAGKYGYAVDYSFQDLRMPRPFSMASISLRTERLPPTFRYMGQVYETAQIQRALSLGTTGSIVVGPAGDVYQRHQGIPSGMYNTAPVNTTNHQMLNPYLMLQAGVPLAVVRDVTQSQYGDDWLASYHQRFLEEKRLAREVERGGMEFTKDAFGVWLPEEGPIPVSAVFLQRTFQRMSDGKVTARYIPHRMMCKFMTAHSDVQTPRQSYERALNMLNLTGNLPHEYGILSAYIHSLGYTPPSYEYIMKTHYLERPEDSMVQAGRVGEHDVVGIEGSMEDWHKGRISAGTTRLFSRAHFRSLGPRFEHISDYDMPPAPMRATLANPNPQYQMAPAPSWGIRPCRVCGEPNPRLCADLHEWEGVSLRHNCVYTGQRFPGRPGMIQWHKVSGICDEFCRVEFYTFDFMSYRFKFILTCFNNQYDCFFDADYFIMVNTEVQLSIRHCLVWLRPLNARTLVPFGDAVEYDIITEECEHFANVEEEPADVEPQPEGSAEERRDNELEEGQGGPMGEYIAQEGEHIEECTGASEAPNLISNQSVASTSESINAHFPGVGFDIFDSSPAISEGTEAYDFREAWMDLADEWEDRERDIIDARHRTLADIRRWLDSADFDHHNTYTHEADCWHAWYEAATDDVAIDRGVHWDILLAGDIEENPGPSSRSSSPVSDSGYGSHSLKAERAEVKRRNRALNNRKSKWVTYRPTALATVEDGIFKYDSFEMFVRDARSLTRGLMRRGDKLFCFSPSTLEIARCALDEGSPDVGEFILSAVWNLVKLRAADDHDAQKRATMAEFKCPECGRLHLWMKGVTCQEVEEIFAKKAKPNDRDDSVSETDVIIIDMDEINATREENIAHLRHVHEDRVAEMEAAEKKRIAAYELASKASQAIDALEGVFLTNAGYAHTASPGEVNRGRLADYYVSRLEGYHDPEDTALPVEKRWSEFKRDRIFFWLEKVGFTHTKLLCVLCGFGSDSMVIPPTGRHHKCLFHPVPKEHYRAIDDALHARNAAQFRGMGETEWNFTVLRSGFDEIITDDCISLVPNPEKAAGSLFPSHSRATALRLAEGELSRVASAPVAMRLVCGGGQRMITDK